jgi:anti-anti-sigma factor
VVFDFQGVNFVSSRHLGMALTIGKVFGAKADMTLTNVSPMVRNVLAVTGLERHFTVV